MMTKWDTIQEDVKDQYVYIEENDMYEKNIAEEEDMFGFTKSIQIEHLTDKQVDEIFDMFGDK